MQNLVIWLLKFLIKTFDSLKTLMLIAIGLIPVILLKKYINNI